MQWLKKERADYRKNSPRGSNSGSDRTISELKTQLEIQELRSQVISLNNSNDQQSVPNSVNQDNMTPAQLSQVTMGTNGSTMMGGRNNRASQKSRDDTGDDQ